MKVINANDSQLLLRHPTGVIVFAEPQSYTYIDPSLVTWVGNFTQTLKLVVAADDAKVDLRESKSHAEMSSASKKHTTVEDLTTAEPAPSKKVPDPTPRDPTMDEVIQEAETEAPRKEKPQAVPSPKEIPLEEPASPAPVTPSPKPKALIKEAPAAAKTDKVKAEAAIDPDKAKTDATPRRQRRQRKTNRTT